MFSQAGMVYLQTEPTETCPRLLEMGPRICKFQVAA